MACLPYPTFLQSAVHTPSARSLSAVGRVRIHPLACPGSSDSGDASPESTAKTAQDEYQEIILKCIQQSQVNISDKSNKDNSKLHKRYMKEAVAMAYSYLSEILAIDVSVVDVEIVLSEDSIIRTDGCLASCFLDAGCAYVVVKVNEGSSGADRGSGLARALDVCDATRIPRERLMLHWKDGTVIDGHMDEITSRVGTFSVEIPPMSPSSSRKNWKDVLPIFKECKCVVQLSIKDDDREDILSDEDLASTVASLSKAIGENGGSISLVDPTAEVLGLCYASCIRTDRPDGLYTTVVCTRNNEALGLVYSSKESLIAALRSGRGVYYSRSRASLWRDSDTLGRHQTLHRIDLDSDSEALRFTVTQHGNDVKENCHLNTLTSWGKLRGLRHLEETLAQRLNDAPPGSYTKRLFDDEQLLRNKLVEEAQELSEADTKQHVAEELADVLYFAMVRAVKAGVSIDDAVAELDKRARKVTRRKGDSKAFRIKAGKEILSNKE